MSTTTPPGPRPRNPSRSSPDPGGVVSPHPAAGPGLPDPRDVLERAVTELHEAVLAHPSAVYPGATFVMLWDALGMLDTDPAAGATEVEAITAGLTQVATLLTGAPTRARWRSALHHAQHAAEQVLTDRPPFPSPLPAVLPRHASTPAET